MDFNERQLEIIRIIKKIKQTNVNDLSMRFNTSSVTIRKDLDELQSRGILLRTHGGAVLAENIESTVPIDEKLGQNLATKRAIAEAAFDLIFDCDTVALDAGTTTLEIAKLIKNSDIKVITNSLLVLKELASRESGSVELIGGTWRKQSQCFLGPIALQTLKRLNVDIAFIGSFGFAVGSGFSCQNGIEGQLKSSLLSRARRKFIVAESAKYAKSAFSTFADFSEIDALITDDDLPNEAYTSLIDDGLNIISARLKDSEDNIEY